ncbi:MAG: DUF4215 domain-containing protein, partial [Candidatus Peregrinibacteria bacterium]
CESEDTDPPPAGCGECEADEDCDDNDECTEGICDEDGMCMEEEDDECEEERVDCGDGIEDEDETCDDGNRVLGDGCDETCQRESMADPLFCGNGKRERGEECDDKNNVSGDGCSAACLLERGKCSDGILQRALGEQCEPALFKAKISYSCGGDCRFLSRYCGNGKLNAGEECDAGAANSDQPGATCRPNCSRARCGDGIRDPGEQCDDGNLLPGDGCSSQCTLDADRRITIDFPGAHGAVGIAMPSAEDLKKIEELPFASLLRKGGKASSGASGGPLASTGPAAIAIMTAGAAAGYAWMRRRAKKK